MHAQDDVVSISLPGRRPVVTSAARAIVVTPAGPGPILLGPFLRFPAIYGDLRNVTKIEVGAGVSVGSGDLRAAALACPALSDLALGATGGSWRVDARGGFCATDGGLLKELRGMRGLRRLHLDLATAGTLSIDSGCSKQLVDSHAAVVADLCSVPAWVTDVGLYFSCSCSELDAVRCADLARSVPGGGVRTLKIGGACSDGLDGSAVDVFSGLTDLADLLWEEEDISVFLSLQNLRTLVACRSLVDLDLRGICVQADASVALLAMPSLRRMRICGELELPPDFDVAACLAARCEAGATPMERILLDDATCWTIEWDEGTTVAIDLTPYLRLAGSGIADRFLFDSPDLPVGVRIASEDDLGLFRALLLHHLECNAIPIGDSIAVSRRRPGVAFDDEFLALLPRLFRKVSLTFEDT